MTTFVSVIHILTCIFLVIFVLLQSGKGAEISASFSGGSQTVFGTSGGVSFVQKLTGILAAIFFITSLSLTVIGGQQKKSLFEGQPLPQAATTQNTAPGAPAAPATAPAAPANAAAPAAPAAPAEPAKKSP